MRVTHVITRLIVGGAQENTIANVLGLQSKPGLQVNLISGPTLGPEGSLESCFNSHPQLLTLVPELVRPVHPFQDWRAFIRLKNIFQSTRPDIVHTHSGKAGFIGRRAAHAAGVPLIVHTIHGPSFGHFQGPLANLLFKTAEGYAACVTSHFVSVADAMTRQYLSAGIGQPSQYTRMFSGFELEPFLCARNDLQLRARLGLTAEDIVIGKIARLFELKGHEDLIAIAPKLIEQSPGMKFLFVGDGAWRERLQRVIANLGLERHFVFTGLIAPERIPEYIGITDAVVHLSRREGLPRALSQALAAARPVVAYDCDGAREVCLDNQTGFLVPVGDLSVLLNRLLRIANEPQLRERLGRTGQGFVRQHFSLQTMVEAHYQLYLNLAKNSAMSR